MSRIHDTPRTDAVLNTFKGSASKLAADLATHAEILERELAARDAHSDAIYKAAVELAAMLEDKLEAERALADMLAKELQWIAKEPEGATTWRMAHVADEALAAWKDARRGSI